MNPVLNVASAMVGFINALTEAGGSILGIFGLPQVITVGSLMINTGALFNAMISVILLVAVFKFLSEYYKYVALGILLIFILSLVGAVV